MKDIDQQLKRAIEADDYASVRIALSRGANVNAVTDSGLSMLQVASKAAGPAVLGLLMERQPNISYADKSGQTALHVSLLSGKFDTAARLIKGKANINYQQNYSHTPLAAALTGYLANRNLRGIKLLLERGADLSLKVRHESRLMTVQQWAEEEGLVEVVSLFRAYAQSNFGTSGYSGVQGVRVSAPAPAPAPVKAAVPAAIPASSGEKAMLKKCDDLADKLKKSAKKTRFKIVR